MNTEEIKHLSKLSCLEFQSESATQVAKELNAVFQLASQLQAVDTTGIEPLFHPIAIIQELSQPLRVDEVTEINARSENLAVAPAIFEGLFLVPKVIE